MELESDLLNPDSRLHVEFFREAVPNKYRTECEGRPVSDDVDFVKISIPGDNTTIIVAAVDNSHKQRFPLHWAHFQNMHNADPLVTGTLITDWPMLSRAQTEELKGLKFFTVESLATASDAQLQTISMIAGMGGHALKDRAAKFLQLAKDGSTVDKQAKELEELRGMVKTLMEGQVKTLAQQKTLSMPQARADSAV